MDLVYLMYTKSNNVTTSCFWFVEFKKTQHAKVNVLTGQSQPRCFQLYAELNSFRLKLHVYHRDVQVVSVFKFNSQEDSE